MWSATDNGLPCLPDPLHHCYPRRNGPICQKGQIMENQSNDFKPVANLWSKTCKDMANFLSA